MDGIFNRNFSEVKPQVLLRTAYIKKFSIDAIGLPGAFFSKERQNPEVAINIGLNVMKISITEADDKEPDMAKYEISLNIDLKATDKSKQPLFNCNISQAGIFDINESEISPEMLSRAIFTIAPPILLPYARHTLLNEIMNSGFTSNPAMLNVVNFDEMYERYEVNKPEESK